MSDVVTTDYLDKRLKESFDDFAVKFAGNISQLLEPRFKAIEDRLDELDRKFEKLTETLDAFLKRLDDIEKDNIARDAQLARLERWIETIAQQTGIKLEY